LGLGVLDDEFSLLVWRQGLVGLATSNLAHLLKLASIHGIPLAIKMTSLEGLSSIFAAGSASVVRANPWPGTLEPAWHGWSK
jgi:hypothetical protein